jgi:hypothetical protein
MIEDTDYFDDIIYFKTTHNSLKYFDLFYIDEADNLGMRWYHCFMQRNSYKLKRGQERTQYQTDCSQKMYECKHM